MKRLIINYYKRKIVKSIQKRLSNDNSLNIYDILIDLYIGDRDTVFNLLKNQAYNELEIEYRYEKENSKYIKSWYKNAK